jgi:hypothetical protein
MVQKGVGWLLPPLVHAPRIRERSTNGTVSVRQANALCREGMSDQDELDAVYHAWLKALTLTRRCRTSRTARPGNSAEPASWLSVPIAVFPSPFLPGDYGISLETIYQYLRQAKLT